jgi:RNA-splicing ligase RtcB
MSRHAANQKWTGEHLKKAETNNLHKSNINKRLSEEAPLDTRSDEVVKVSDDAGIGNSSHASSQWCSKG